MTRSFKAELLRLLRPAVIAGTVGTLALVSVLATILIFALTGSEEPGQPSGSTTVSTTETRDDLVQPDGFAGAFGFTSQVVAPVLALALFAVNLGSEHRFGTLRVLLLHQPRRRRLLAGKLAALSFLMVLALLAALLAAVVAGLLAGLAFEADTTGWLSLAGLRAGASALANAVVMAVGWGLVGATAAAVTRSSAGAIAIGVGYLLAVDGILGGAVRAIRPWLPGTVFRGVGTGGAPELAYDRALAVGAAYMAVLLLVSLTIYARRDVTD